MTTGTLCRRLCTLVVLVAQAHGLLGCDRWKPKPADETGEGGVKGCRVQIALVTSVGESSGQEQIHGLELARDEINASGGISDCKLELVVKDDASDERAARMVTEELVAMPRLLALFGTNSTRSTMSALAVSEHARVPFIVPSVSGGLVTSMGYKWVFRLAAPDYAFASALFKFIDTLPQHLELRTIAVVYPHWVSSQGMFVAVQNEAREHGIAVVVEEQYRQNVSDFRNELSRVKQAAPDIVFLDANRLDDAVALMAQAKEIDLSPKLFMANAGPFVQPGFAASGEYVTVGAQWTKEVPWHDAQGQDATGFDVKYSNRFHAPPGVRAVSSYTGLYVLKQAIEQAAAGRPVDWTNLPAVRLLARSGLQRINVPDTLFGPVQFDQDGQNLHPVLMTQVQNGAHVLVYPEKTRTGVARLPVPSWKDRP